MRFSGFLAYDTSRIGEEIFMYLYRVCPLFPKPMRELVNENGQDV
jgi:hypothetical protein